jgi:hypothetical protein
MTRYIVLLLLIARGALSQNDSVIGVPLVVVNFSGQIPFADMAARFGPNLSAGGAFMYKTNRNFILGIESNFMFGRNVNEDVLSQLRTPEGYVIDNEGYPADLRVTERGGALHVTGGKVLKLLSANANSGLMITVGAGVLQHKIKLYDAQQNIAAIRGDLVYGYDRLSLGISFSQFVGYLFLGENRMLNFYMGFETYQALTKSVRKFNYDTGLPDTQQRLDILGGFRFGWILPLYKKRPDTYYYY